MGEEARHYAEVWGNFLGSLDGKLQQEILGQAILNHLPETAQTVLDAGSGTGWLCNLLAEHGHAVVGLEKNLALLNQSRFAHPTFVFYQADLEQPLSLPMSFSAIVANTVLQDLSDPKTALENLYQLAQPGALLLLTLPNPETSYPNLVWKRGFLGKLLRRHPKPVISDPQNPYSVSKGRPHAVFPKPLEDYLKAAEAAGWQEEARDFPGYKETTPQGKWGLAHQLSQVPLFVLLKLRKPSN